MGDADFTETFWRRENSDAESGGRESQSGQSEADALRALPVRRKRQAHGEADGGGHDEAETETTAET